MSNCSNCYNGCTEIVSDRCVKYTGIDVPVLGIQTGDSLSFVEQALITFLTSTLDGTGIILDINSSIICDVVKQYLPTCRDINVLDLSIALIKATCKLQEELDLLDEAINVIEAPYTTNCLAGVTSSSGTHSILQVTINTLCTLKTDFNGLLLNLPNTYVQIDELDALIQAYLDGSGEGSLIKNRMVPYAAVPYYGPITYFNGSGAGTGDWINVYLCNGNNGTPDLRGRTLVGVTDGTMLGGTMAAAVDPTVAGNPNYSIGTVTGANQIVLNNNQIPSHTHTITNAVTVTDDGHRHKFSDDSTNPTNTLRSTNDIIPFVTTPSSAIISGTGTGSGLIYETSNEETGVTVSVSSSAAPFGGGLAHSNIQPSIGCRYIIYIP
jgi:microcystin-dependent protein